MKKLMRLPLIAVMLVTLITALLFSSPQPLLADESTAEPENMADGKISSKEEVVYCTLDNIGAVKDVYVVNILNVIKAGTVFDYGKYSSIKNLTDTKPIVIDGDKLKITAAEGRYYYQGNLDKANLPWITEVSYYVDGVKTAPNELAGAKGQVKISIKTKKNTLIDSGFYDNYLLQVSIPLSTEKFFDISASGAALANAGANKLITFTVMPGTEGDLSIEAYTNDFDFEGIELSAVPFSMEIEIPDISEYTEDLSALTDAIAQLSTGMVALKDGLAEISSGASTLNKGSSDFNAGLSAINQRSSELVTASNAIMGALNNFSAMMSSPEAMAANPQLAYGLSELSKNFTSFHMGLEGYTQGISQLAGSYSGIHYGISSLAGGTKEIYSGAAEISSGANTLGENTRDLPDKITTLSEDLLSDYDKSDYGPVSFISSENSNVKAVQFVMKTEKIQKEETQASQVIDSRPQTFWTRLMDLFK